MTSVQSNYGVGTHYPYNPDFDEYSDFDDKYAPANRTVDHGVMYRQPTSSYDGSSVSGVTAPSYGQKSACAADGYRPTVQYQQFETTNYYNSGRSFPHDETQYEQYQQVQPQAQAQVQAPVKAQVPAQAQPQPAAKPTGGISAVIDYDMEVMARFVCACAYSIIGLAEDLAANKQKRDYIEANGGVDCFSVCKSIKPFVLAGMRAQISPMYSSVVTHVQRVLESTRLPHESILTGIYYLAERVGKLPLEDPDLQDEAIYGYIVTALLLGSKFHDDNTFHNRSWAEVSGIRLSQLNMIETNWLAAVGYSLFPMGGKFREAKAWHELFKSYEQSVEELEQRDEVWADPCAPESPMAVHCWAGRPVVNTASPASTAGSRSYYGGSALPTPPNSASSDSRLSSSGIWSSSASSALSQDGGWGSISSRQTSLVASPASSEQGPTTPPYVDPCVKHNNNPYHSMLQSWPGSTESFQHYSNNPYHQVDTRNYGFDHLHMQTGCGQGAFPATYYPSAHFLPPMVNATSW